MKLIKEALYNQRVSSDFFSKQVNADCVPKISCDCIIRIFKSDDLDINQQKDQQAPITPSIQ